MCDVMIAMVHIVARYVPLKFKKCFFARREIYTCGTVRCTCSNSRFTDREVYTEPGVLLTHERIRDDEDRSSTWNADWWVCSRNFGAGALSARSLIRRNLISVCEKRRRPESGRGISRVEAGESRVAC